MCLYLAALHFREFWTKKKKKDTLFVNQAALRTRAGPLKTTALFSELGYPTVCLYDFLASVGSHQRRHDDHDATIGMTHRSIH